MKENYRISNMQNRVNNGKANYVEFCHTACQDKIPEGWRNVERRQHSCVYEEWILFWEDVIGYAKDVK